MSRWAIGVVAVAAVAFVAFVIAGGSSDDRGSNTVAQETATQPGAEAEQPLGREEERGRELFVQNCGSCHTLDAAGTQGAVGPNLGEVQLDEQDVLSAIREGGREPGSPMPPDLVTGQDAEAVARFVANSGPGV